MSGSFEPRGLQEPVFIQDQPHGFSARAVKLRALAELRLGHQAMLRDFLSQSLPQLPDTPVQFNGLNTQAFLQQFSKNSQKGLLELFGESGIEGLLSISQENSSECFASELLHLGQSLANSEHESGAAALWSYLAKQKTEAFAETALQAGLELKALLGNSDSPYAFEVLLRGLNKNITDFSTLGGVIAGSMIAQGVKAFSLSRLLGQAPSWYNRGLALSFATEGLAFAAEVPAITLSNKGLQTALGRPQDWGWKSLANDGLQWGVNLFFMKAFGSLAQRSFRTFHGLDASGTAAPQLSALTRLSEPLFTQAGMWGGITLGQQALLGLEGKGDPTASHSWMHSLATLLELNVGAQLAGNVMGAEWSRAMQALEIRARAVESPRTPPQGRAKTWEFPRNPLLLPKNRRLAFAGPEGIAPDFGASELPEKPFVSKMATAVSGSGSASKFLARRLSSLLEGRYGADPRIDKIVEHFSNTEFSYAPQEAEAAYFELLGRSQVKDYQYTDGRVTPALDILQTASRVLRYTLEMNPMRRAVGSFYDYMMQVAFERVLQEKRVHPFDELMRIATIHRSQASLESFFVSYSLNIPYELNQSLWRHSLDKKPEWVESLSALPLSQSSRNRIGNYLATFSMGKFSERFRDPEFNYLMLKPMGGDPKNVPMQAEFAVRVLKNILEDPKLSPDWAPILEACVQRSKASAVPMLYFDRLFKILATGDLNEKISEIAFGRDFNALELAEKLSAVQPDPGFRKAGEALDGTVYTAYFNDPILAKKFARFYRALETLLHPKEQSRNRADFHRKAEELLAGKDNFGREEVLEMLYHRPTETAKLARSMILKGELDFKVYSQSQMQRLWKALKKKGPLGETPSGIFLPAAKRSRGKALIAITELDPKLSRDEKILRAVYLPAFAVHEFEHFLHHGELSYKKLHELVRGEMRSWLEENYLLLQHGETAEWAKALELSPLGMGIYLRNLIDRDYIQGPRDLVFERRP